MEEAQPALTADPRQLARQVVVDEPSLAVAAGRLPVNAGIKLSDAEPLAYVAGAAIVVLVAVLASLTNARRAAAVDPMVALRST